MKSYYVMYASREYMELLTPENKPLLIQLKTLELELDIKTATLARAFLKSVIFKSFSFVDICEWVEAGHFEDVKDDEDADHSICFSKFKSMITISPSFVETVTVAALEYQAAKSTLADFKIKGRLSMTSHWLKPKQPASCLSANIVIDGTRSLIQLADAYPFRELIEEKLTSVHKCMVAGLLPSEMNCYVHGLCGGRRGCTRGQSSKADDDPEHIPWTHEFWAWAAKQVATKLILE